MIRTEGLEKYVDDRLKVCWWKRSCKRVYCQRKRLPNNTKPVVKEIQSHYVVGTVSAVKFIRDTYNMSLRDSLNVLNYLRYPNDRYDAGEFFSAEYLKNF